MSYFKKVKQSIIYALIFTIIGSVAAILLRATLARYLQPEQYGLFYAVFGFVMFIYMFRDLGTSSALAKFIAEWRVEKKNDHINQGTTSVILIQLIVVTGLAAILLLSRSYLAEYFFKTPIASTLIVILTILLFFEIIFNTLINFFIGIQANGVSTSMNAIRIVLVIVISWIFLFLGYGVLSPAFGYLIATIICVIAYFVILKYRCWPHFAIVKENREVTITLLTYGKFLLLTGLGSMILSNTDTVMITWFRNVTEVGYYNAALPIVNMLISAGGLFLMILVPLASELYTAKKQDILVHGIELLYKYFFFITLPILALLLIFSKDIILVFFGQEYLTATPVLQILVIGGMLTVFSSLNLGLLIGIGQARLQTITFAIMAVLNIILNTILIPPFGIVGAAIATSTSYFVGFIISLWFVRAKLHVSPVYRFKNWLFNIIIAALCAVGTIWSRPILSQTIPGTYWLHLLLSVLVFAASYLVLCVIFRIVKKEEIQELTHMTFKI